MEDFLALKLLKWARKKVWQESEYMMSRICCLIIETGECQFCLPLNQIHIYYVLNLVWKITSIKDYEKMTKYLSHLLQLCLEQRWHMTSTDDQKFLLLSSCILVLNFFQKRHLCKYDGVEHPTGSGSILSDDVLLLNRVVTCVLDSILIENSSEWWKYILVFDSSHL